MASLLAGYYGIGYLDYIVGQMDRKLIVPTVLDGTYVIKIRDENLDGTYYTHVSSLSSRHA